MQTLAAYSLEADLEESEANRRLDRVASEVNDWLQAKGVSDPALKEGFFRSLSGDEGTYTRSCVTYSGGKLQHVQLDESTPRGETFTTTIQAACSGRQVAVFVTLALSTRGVAVAPVQVYPRCPLVVRKLIDSYKDWTFGGQLVPHSIPADTREYRGGKELSDELRNPARNFPIVVISSDEDEVTWPTLHTDAARELVGLAQVAVVDEQASWTMTAELGKQQSCFLGAVRLYWPGTDGARLHSVLWTAGKLATYGADANGARNFLASLRRTLMSAAALNVSPPVVVRNVQNAIVRERLASAEGATRDQELDAIIEENSNLLQRLKEAEGQREALRWKLLHYQERLREVTGEEEEEEAGDEGAPPAHVSAASGEVRYYKKIGNKGGVDELVTTGPCNHNAWRPAFKAIQAEKGLQKLEGQSGWRSLAHCGTCTGGGRWRVQW